MDKPKKFKNEIIGHYRGFPYKTYNMIFVRVNVTEFKRFIDAKIDYGYSQKEAIKRLNLLCDPCNKITPVKFTDEKTQ